MEEDSVNMMETGNFEFECYKVWLMTALIDRTLPTLRPGGRSSAATQTFATETCSPPSPPRLRQVTSHRSADSGVCQMSTCLNHTLPPPRRKPPLAGLPHLHDGLLLHPRLHHCGLLLQVWHHQSADHRKWCQQSMSLRTQCRLSVMMKIIVFIITACFCCRWETVD